MSSSDASDHLTVALASNRAPSLKVSPLQMWQRGRRSISFVLLLAVGLIVLGDILFYQRSVGWTLGIFLFAAAVAITLRSHRYWRYWSGRVIVAGVILLCLALIENPGPLRIALALLGIASLAIINAYGFTYDVPQWLKRWSEMIARWWLQLPIDVIQTRRWRNSHGPNGRLAVRSAVNWIVPIGLSLVFLGLFAAANPIISGWLSNIGATFSQIARNFSEYVSVGRVGLWLLIGLPAWALLRARLRWWRHRMVEVQHKVVERRPLLSSDLLLRCLIVFNLVFAVQLTLDMITVVSQGSSLPEGMTYAEYARRGAYPLVATALLAAAFVLIALPSGPRTRVGVGTRFLVYLWIGQNIMLTASAVWRLWMYVDAFGLTRLRIAAAIWMLLVTLGLIYIVWRIVGERSNAWLLRVNTVTLLAVLFICCFVNFERIIAWEGALNNFELKGEGSPRIDLRYVRKMGPEAIPALEWFALRMGPEDRVGNAAAEQARILRAELNQKLQTWHGWTLRRHRVATTPSLLPR